MQKNIEAVNNETISFENLLINIEMTVLELYVITLSKEREPSWEVISIHKKIDEITAAKAVASAGAALFRLLAKELQKRLGALLGQCDTFFTALQTARERGLMTKKEFARGLRINSATNLAKHRIEPVPHEDLKKKEPPIQRQDSSSDSEDDGNCNEEDIFSKNLELQGNKKPTRTDISLVDQHKKRQMALQHELIEAILKGNLQEIINLCKKGASLKGPSVIERCKLFEDWLEEQKQKINKEKPSSSHRYIESCSQSSQNDSDDEGPVQYMNLRSFDATKIMSPLTAAAISLEPVVFEYVLNELGKDVDWSLVYSDLLIQNIIYSNSQRVDQCSRIAFAVSMTDREGEPGIIIKDAPSTAAQNFVLIYYLLDRDKRLIFPNRFQKVQAIYEEKSRDKIEVRPNNATYEWLARWFEKNAHESWVSVYNHFTHKEGAAADWCESIRILMNNLKLNQVVGAKTFSDIWSKDGMKKNPIIPSPEEHDRAVNTILEQKLKLKQLVLMQLNNCENQYNIIFPKPETKPPEPIRPPADPNELLEQKIGAALATIRSVPMLKKALDFGSFYSSRNNTMIRITYVPSKDYPVTTGSHNRSARRGRGGHLPSLQFAASSGIDYEINIMLKELGKILSCQSLFSCSVDKHSLNITCIFQSERLSILLKHLKKEKLVTRWPKQEPSEPKSFTP